MTLTGSRLRGASAAVIGLGTPTAALAEWALNMPRGVTPISQEAYDLHMLILWICVAIGVVVFAAMFYAMYKHRKAAGAEPAQFHHSTTAEIVWTVIPILILVAMAVPATGALIRMEDTSEAEVTIKATGYQWKWRYEYQEDDVEFYSNLALTSRAAINDPDVEPPEHYLLEVDNDVVIPVDKKVRLLLTADDVIHAWWVPEFGMKKDAIPGFINEMWIRADTIGTYRGQCAELCGRDHGFMPIVVDVVSEEDYAAWVAESKMAAAQAEEAVARSHDLDSLMREGERVYASTCAACHQPDGAGIAGTFPSIKDSPVATGEVDAHIALVLDGREGTAMRGFETELSDLELAAVLTYQRNAFGNGTGDVVQPARVSAAREL